CYLLLSAYLVYRVRVETELGREKSITLKTTNQDKEAFNNTIAHDLRTHLNTLSLSCQAIEIMCTDKLDEECRCFVRNISNRTLQMNELISALLTFSCMGHVKPQREKIDLSVLAQEVFSMLQQTEPERQVDFRICDGIEANGDARLLRVVLDNLIGNAWKYTGKQEKAVIEVGVSEIEGVPTYFVRDNGIGFDKADAGKLFVPFQRLPGAETSKGYGIGLATVERIIRRHGGRIWAEGKKGNGACFYFTLAEAGHTE
ncbi:MAG: ATP-binding protein, partial [Desulfuromonadales bacterium]|nr:ATP-binding protein [Desulfuromonadales bacterium]